MSHRSLITAPDDDFTVCVGIIIRQELHFVSHKIVSPQATHYRKRPVCAGFVREGHVNSLAFHTPCFVSLKNTVQIVGWINDGPVFVNNISVFEKAAQMAGWINDRPMFVDNLWSSGWYADIKQSITKTSLFKCIENFTTKNWKFSDKNSDIFNISAQNIDCGTR